jgi:hypothetical protein
MSHQILLQGIIQLRNNKRKIETKRILDNRIIIESLILFNEPNSGAALNGS